MRSEELIRTQRLAIEMQIQEIVEQADIIKNQHTRIKDLEQQVGRWEVCEQYRKEGSI